MNPFDEFFDGLPAICAFFAKRRRGGIPDMCRALSDLTCGPQKRLNFARLYDIIGIKSKICFGMWTFLEKNDETGALSAARPDGESGWEETQ